MIISKTELVKKYISRGEFEKALCIAKGFKMGDKELLNTIKLGYDCLKNPNFYKQLGKDTEVCVRDGIEAMIELVSVKSDV